MEEENIITVRNRNLQKADEAFADFMFMLESYLNEKAAAIPGTYCDCKSKELENVVVNVMKELCGRNSFPCGGDTLGFRPIFSRYYRGEILWG